MTKKNGTYKSIRRLWSGRRRRCIHSSYRFWLGALLFCLWLHTHTKAFQAAKYYLHSFTHTGTRARTNQTINHCFKHIRQNSVSPTKYNGRSSDSCVMFSMKCACTLSCIFVVLLFFIRPFTTEYIDDNSKNYWAKCAARMLRNLLLGKFDKTVHICKRQSSNEVWLIMQLHFFWRK